MSGPERRAIERHQEERRQAEARERREHEELRRSVRSRGQAERAEGQQKWETFLAQERKLDYPSSIVVHVCPRRHFLGFRNCRFGRNEIAYHVGLDVVSRSFADGDPASSKSTSFLLLLPSGVVVKASGGDASYAPHFVMDRVCLSGAKGRYPSLAEYPGPFVDPPGLARQHREAYRN